MELSAQSNSGHCEVKEGAVMAEVVVTLDGGQELVSVITADSARRLGLVAGRRVTVVVKSTEVMLATNE